MAVMGSRKSAERVGRLGLPMALALISGDIRDARALAEYYREAGAAAGHSGTGLRLRSSTS